MIESSKCFRCNLPFLPAENVISYQHWSLQDCLGRLKVEVNKLKAVNEVLERTLSEATAAKR